MKIQKFNRKTFQVDAIRVTKGNMAEVAEWCQGEIKTAYYPTENYGKSVPDGTKYIKVRVLRPLSEKQTMAFVGDWVLYAGTGYKVYTNKSFWTCFEKKSVRGHKPGPTIADEINQMEKIYDNAVKELKKHSGSVLVVEEGTLHQAQIAALAMENAKKQGLL